MDDQNFNVDESQLETAAEESTNEPANEPTNEPANEPTNEPANEPTEDESTSEPTNEESGDDDEESTNEPDGESDDDESYVDALAAQLTENDPDRFAALTERFVSDAEFEPDDIKWISEITGHNEATVRYGLSMQRELYRAEQAAETNRSVEAAQAEVGNIDELIGFAKANAPADKLNEWQAVVNYAKRTGDDEMTLKVLREIKALKDAQPAPTGGKLKTLGHLSATQPSTEKVTQLTTEPEPANEPVNEPDPLVEQMARLNNQALARIATGTNGDPATVSRALDELKRRGVIG